MANPIETATRYIGSVLWRTPGFEAAGLVVKTPLADTFPSYSWRDILGRAMLRHGGWIHQATFPAATEFWSHYNGVKTPKLDRNPRVLAAMLIGAYTFDTIMNLIATPYLSRKYNLEPLAVKAALNIATHVGLDLASRAIDKMKGLRPTSGVTLAV